MKLVVRMKIGAHISIRNGYFGAAKFAKTIGASVFQYFPKNPRSLTVKEFDEVDAKNCMQYCQENSLESVAHAPYPSNLAATDKEREKVILSILNDLQIAETCGSIGVVVHFASIKNVSDPLEGYKRMIDILNEVLHRWDGKCQILIENNAGKSGPMGTTLEELVQIRSLTEHPNKIGFCFDTCHGFASGLWNGENWEDVVGKGKELGYFNHLKAIHFNNSMYDTGSMRDRHANIHNGYITTKQMEKFLSSSIIQEIPLILETPTSENYTHSDEIKYIVNQLIKQ